MNPVSERAGCALLSMTGFGRGHVCRDGREIYVEIKSVNHRFLDIGLRTPRPLAFLEETLREWIRNGGIRRGHLEVSVTYRNTRADARTVSVDRVLVEQCAKETQEIADALHKESPSVSELIRLCDAMTIAQAEEDTNAVTALAEEAFAEALAGLQAMRGREGIALRDDLRENLQSVEAIAVRIARLAPEVPREYREKLLKRLREWDVEAADPARIAQEVALMADRCAIDEELFRLNSHFRQFAACFDPGEEAGRRMDFLLQEMNREINTIGSKASHAEISACVVEMKSLLEKLREQVQNVE